MKSYGKVPYKIVVVEPITMLHQLSSLVGELAWLFSIWLSPCSAWREYPGSGPCKGPLQYETATYREGHSEVLQSHTRELEGMKLAAKTSDRQTFPVQKHHVPSYITLVL